MANTGFKVNRWFVYILCWVIIGGCSVKRGGQKKYSLGFPGQTRGVYHTVSKGQTLWRIAKTYGVDVEKIAMYNRLDDKSTINVGQKLYIPGASRVKYVAPYQKTAAANSKHISKRKNNQKTKKIGYLPRPENLAGSAKIEFIWPIKGKITSRYSSHGGTHFGLDVAAPKDTPIKAAASGRVSYVGYQPLSYGNFIIIQHSHDYASVYAHNSQNLVKVGQYVNQGTIIANVGSTGNSTGNHLHFEIRYKRKARNPLWYLPPQN